MDLFIVFGTIGILFLVSITIIFRLMYQMSDMKYELKLGKINCQKAHSSGFFEPYDNSWIQKMTPAQEKESKKKI